MAQEDRKAILRSLFDAGVAAAHPAICLPPALPAPPPQGRLVILAAGKGAAAMAHTALEHYRTSGFPEGRIAGIAVTRHGHGLDAGPVRVVEAGHPYPDEAGLAATRDVLSLAGAAGADDLVLVLLSGGGSANWIAPAEGITLDGKQALTRQLLRSGAAIGEINAVRKHLSRIKGGRLARLAAPARLVTLAISDVPGDDPSVIASGPTVPDPSTAADARAVLARYGIAADPAIATCLADAANETAKADDPAFVGTHYAIIARPANALEAVARAAAAQGYEVVSLGADVEGEAREVASAHADMARRIRHERRRAAILSGGELTVTIKGEGRGGPNQEYALALAIHLEGLAGVTALAGDSDGADGGAGSPDDPAGAFIDDTTLARAAALRLKPALSLADNDSRTFFAALGDLLFTGPTRTNVNDLRIILVD